MPSQLEEALAYAKRGWPIIPCKLSKEPYTKHGITEATTSPKQIKKWWAEHPNANIGLNLGMVNLMTIDLDPGHDWDQIEAAMGPVPETHMIAKTPRGEHHSFMMHDGEAVPNSASKIAPHVDIKSGNGYIILPPGKTANGVYEWIEYGEPALRTKEMLEACGSAGRKQREDHDTWIIEADIEEHVERAIKWLENDAQVSVQDQGGDAMAYATAAYMKSLGVSQAMAGELMWDHWNPRCEPPWEVDELDQKVANGYSYNSSAPGNMTDLYHIEKKKLLFAEPATVIIEDGGKTVISLNERFRIVDYKARLLIKPPKWMIPDFLVEDSYAMIFGATGTFKTFLALDIALQVATGGAGDTAMWPKVIAQGKVLFIAGEGRAAVAKRVTAWEKIHNKGEPVKEFYLGDPVPMISEALEPFLKAALEMSSDGYKLVVIDTISRAMAGSNDNSAEYATQFTAMVQEMQKELHCTVLALHHTGHQGDHARGSSVFHNEPDTIMRVEREPKSKIVSLLVKKQKDGVEWEDERYALLQHHPIAGDPEGTLVVVKGSRDTAATKSGKGMTPERYKNTQAVNAAVLRVVKRERQKKGGWTNNAMALACAADEDVNISDSTIDRAIATIRNDKSKWSAGHAYDGPDGKWAWKYLPDSKRDRFNV